ncbi:Winged helix-turn-helix protein [Marine Group I thaumarchaeote SCGC AAA799-O18]|jgi:predicted transcriptional regulator|nr:Winged helix-turn-helix protein [Marine Group I thaumarchaeote SCGC AAA799-O18]
MVLDHILKITTVSRIMASYRTHIKIVGEILDTTLESVDEYDGTSITHLIRKANISHGRLSVILNNLVSQGLLEQVNSEGCCRYKISSSGQEFLSAYKTFRDFSEDFGLTI